MYLGGRPNPNELHNYIRGFYQCAPVPPNHPKESWFGLQISMYETYWIDRDGEMRNMNGGLRIPF